MEGMNIFIIQLNLFFHFIDEMVEKKNDTIVSEFRFLIRLLILTLMSINVIESVVSKLLRELNNEKREEIILQYKEILIEEPELLPQSKSFCTLPISFIATFIKEINYEDIDNTAEYLMDFVCSICNAHQNDPNLHIFLESIPSLDCLTSEDITTILSQFKNIPICNQLGSIRMKMSTLPILDFEDQIKQRDNQIQELQKTIESLSLQLRQTIDDMEKPIDFEPDIFKACENGKLSSIQYLVHKEPGCELKRDSKGDLPLHTACRFNKLNIVMYFIQKMNMNIELTNNSGFTPLHCACFKNNLETIKFLVQQHANIEKASVKGTTPLHLACVEANIEVAHYLVNEAHANVNSAPKLVTPLHEAARHCPELIHFLISKGSNKEAKTKNGYTPLLTAAAKKYQSVKILIEEEHVNINALTNKKDNALHIACKQGKLEIVKYLIEVAGMDKNCKGSKGYTPLHMACEGNQKEVVEYLINEQNVDCPIKSSNGLTALDLKHNIMTPRRRRKPYSASQQKSPEINE